MKKSELRKIIREEIKKMSLLKEHGYTPGMTIKFKDGEEWIVTKPGMRGNGEQLKPNEVYIKPYNKLAKDRNVSLGIDVDIDYINKNKV